MMNVLIKFLSMEPSENLVTALHFCLDKIIFFGYEEYISARKQETEAFLKKHCAVKELEFSGLDQYEFQPDADRIRQAAAREKASGNAVFLDLTGAEGLAMAAFGLLGNEMDLPMHIYDIPRQRLTELNSREGVKPISAAVKKQEVSLDLDRFIEMRGGVINYRLHKEIKGINNRETDERIARLWKLFVRYEAGWSAIAGIMQKAKTGSDLRVNIDARELRAALKKEQRFTAEDFLQFVRDAEGEDLFRQVRIYGRSVSFVCASSMIRNCLIDAGSILELHVYRQLRRQMPNSKVGVHLDWDGVIHRQSGEDVLNEVDVIALKGLVPTFISCKIGKATKTALYELLAVTNRFGGKYAKMVLVTAKGMSDTDLKRAKEMGISIVNEDMLDITDPV